MSRSSTGCMCRIPVRAERGRCPRRPPAGPPEYLQREEVDIQFENAFLGAMGNRKAIIRLTVCGGRGDRGLERGSAPACLRQAPPGYFKQEEKEARPDVDFREAKGVRPGAQFGREIAYPAVRAK